IRARAEHVNGTGHQFLVRATDIVNNSADATMNITVVQNQDLKPPIWLEKPLRLSATVGQQFAFNVSDKAKDPNTPPRPLRFAKVANPTWVNMSDSGTISGFPQAGQAGDHQFQITVSNDIGTDTNTVILTVRDGSPQGDNFVIDKPVANAPAEILWVIDNAWNWFWPFKDRLTKDLLNAASTFYSELNSAGIRHTSVFISSDAHRKGGLPIPDDNQRQLLRWDDTQWARSFADFVNNIFVRECYSSPLWSMHLFYSKVPTLWEIYQNGYMEPGVPMDALIVTKQVDQYKRYATSAPFNQWGPTDYADDFIRFHKGEQKPYRVSAVAAACPQLMDPHQQPNYASAQSAYQEVAIRTGGDYYPWNCNSDMGSYLRDFAQKVKRRAYIHANKRFQLSKKPLDPTKITVKLGSTVLSGNTGTSSDQWRYDSFANEVLVFWHNIDTGNLPPGVQLSIEYQGTN
ncbi:MAG: hypothetical protein KDD39_15910, partial [Bdellovibrionales bacterium]|nr:hypothetical protein [Bdellovibrionales bacterium]